MIKITINSQNPMETKESKLIRCGGSDMLRGWFKEGISRNNILSSLVRVLRPHTSPEATDKKESSVVCVSDGTFDFNFRLTDSGKPWHWSGRIIDYTKYTLAVAGMFTVLRILTEAGYLSGTFGSISVQDGDRRIYHQVVCLPNGSDPAICDAYASTFDTLDANQKFMNKSGDILLLFCHEETITDSWDCETLKAPDGDIELPAFYTKFAVKKSRLSFGTNILINRCEKSGRSLYKMIVSPSGYILMRQFFGSMFAIMREAPTLDKLFILLERTVECRGLEIVDFDKLKQEIRTAEEKIGEHHEKTN